MADWQMTRKRTAVFDAAVTDAAGAAMDCTGCVLRFTAKRSPGDPDSAAIVSLYSPSNGIAWVSQVGGTATITVPPASTAALDRHTVLAFDLALTDGAGNPYPVDSGTLEVLMNVTETTP